MEKFIEIIVDGFFIGIICYMGVFIISFPVRPSYWLAIFVGFVFAIIKAL